MAERYVRMNVLSSGTEKAKASLDELAERARALGAESPEIKATVEDTQAVARMKDLKLKIDILNRERAEIAVNMKGDEATKAKLLDIKARLRDLDEKVTPEIKLKDADKTEASLIKIKLLMDDIHSKKVDLEIAKGGEAKSILSRLGRASNKGILGIPKDPGGGNGENAVAGLLNGSPGAFLTNPIVAGPLGSLLASLLPAITGLGIGGLVGGGAFAGGLFGASSGTTALKADNSNITQLQKAIASKSTPKNQLPQDKLDLAAANKQFNKDSKFYEPFLEFQKSLKDLGQNLLAPLRTVMGPLQTIFQGFGKWLKMMGPELSDMFKASMPFVKAFMMVLEQGGKALIPAFTQAMNTMVKSGALTEMTQALVLLIKDGLVPFIKLMGPGMKASAIVFKAVIIALNGVFVTLGAAATFIAREMVMLGHAVVDVGKIFYDIGRVIAALLGGNWKAMGNAVKALGNNFRNFFATLLSMLSDGFVKIQGFGKDVAHVFDNIRHAVAQAWDATWTWVGHRFMSFYNDDLHMMTNLRHSISNTFDNIRHDIANIWDNVWHDVESRARSGMDNALNEIKQWNRNITNNFDSLRHGIAHIWDQMWGDVKSITMGGVRGVGNAIHGIEGAFQRPIAFVVNDVWDRLAGIWNKITGIVHLSSLKLPIAHFADGGRVMQGSGPRSDDVLARVSKGETVVSAAHSNRLAGIFGAIGVPGYAAGGIPNPLKAVGGFFSHIGKDILGDLAKPVDWIKQHIFGSISGLLGSIPGSATGMSDVLKALTTDVIASLSGKAHNAGQQAVSMGKYRGRFGAGAAQWRGTALKALSMEGLSSSLVGQVLTQIQSESSGNPNAINLTDSNAQAGDPSRGLLQTIMTTFRANHWPGTSWDIYNPLANIAAAINYARHRYGPTLINSAGVGIGSGHGYLHGGWINEPVVGMGLRSGQRYSFAENGLPEYVSPHGSHPGGAGGVNIYITVSGDTDPDAAARRIHQKLRRYKKHIGNVPLGLG